jgi:nucleotide-binding universal stress UspA family protein
MKRLLVAVDNSPRAASVLTAAASLAERTGAKLVLFRALGLPTELPREIFIVPDARVEDILKSSAHAELDRLASLVRPELIERITTAIGTAWDAIVREARDIDADLIVIGSHGFSGIDRLLGTTAAKVVNHADRNVLVVRTPL